MSRALLNPLSSTRFNFPTQELHEKLRDVGINSLSLALFRVQDREQIKHAVETKAETPWGATTALLLATENLQTTTSRLNPTRCGGWCCGLRDRQPAKITAPTTATSRL